MTDKRVAVSLLEHFNRKTGQCDPGIERLAGLLSVSTRTVIRSIHRLVRLGLFQKDRHGGHLNRNRYEPMWSRFRDIDAAWSVRFRAKRGALICLELSPAPCQPCHLAGDSAVTQTFLSNQIKETCAKQPARQGPPQHDRGPSPTGSIRPADAASVSAERRWSTDLTERFAARPLIYSEIIRAVTPPMQAVATEAELRQRGGGMRLILDQLQIAPPASGEP